MKGEQRVWAIVPVKAFTRGKSRLSSVLEREARAVFARGLLGHVLAQLRQTRGVAGVLVVTDGDDVAEHAVGLGLEVLRDPARATLAEIVDAALMRALELGATAALVCMADLPRLQNRELSEVLDLLHNHDVVIAPDLQGLGTNLLALSSPLAMPTCFGHVDSFQRHLAAASGRALALVVQRAPGICFDVDGPDDLANL